MSTALNVVLGLFTGLALLLLLVAARAWWHARTARIGLLAAAFLLFLAKGLLLTVGIFRDSEWHETLILPSLVLDGAALGLVYLAVLRKS